ncbi:hypothetical protein [Piscinibacter terrae]|uniref:Uncharacterized protein n=1 Tax=Piscinibacter terrae TaxID=2496871 RepID=A0A3N7HUM0_9BURK|nr:hypothetical protein [Albitalea terrae]RQP25523.1 hypothetical protein DZC73_00085 [Albitalea terrae]
MDIHHKVVAVLHVVFAAITLLVIAALTLFFGVLTALFPSTEFPLAIFAAFGAALAVPFVLVAVAELVAGAAFLAGRQGARPWLIGMGALQLLNLPFGTALGIYTLWALMRTEQPVVQIVCTPTSLSRS